MEYIVFNSFYFFSVVGSRQNWSESNIEIYHMSLHSCAYYPHYQYPPQQSGTFITINEPILTHLYHPKSIVYIRVHSWCYTFYEFGQMYTGISCFIAFCFIVFHRYCVSYKLKVCGNSAMSKSIGIFFFQQHLLTTCLTHFDNSWNTSNFPIIIIFVVVICDQWSLMLPLWLTEVSDDS